jgi:hypothetical protein
MAGNSRPSFTKRQKERARQEKQAAKAQKRAEKKLAKDEPKRPAEGNPTITYDEEGNPEGLAFHDFSDGEDAGS